MALQAGGIEYEISVITEDLINARRDIQELNQKIDSSMDASSKSVDKLSTRMTDLAKTVAGVVAGMQFTSFIVSTGEAIEQQKIFADSIDVSYAQLQRLQFAAGKSGVEIDSFNDALKEMVIQINEAGKGDNEDLIKNLNKMGIAIEDLEKMSVDQQFFKIAEGMNTLADASDRVVLANDLFGEEATNLLSLIGQGTDTIKQYANQLDDLGGVVSDDVAQGFIEFNNHLRDTGTALKGAAITGLASMASSMAGLSEVVVGFLSDGERLQSIIDGIGKVAYATATIVTARLVASFATYVATQTAALTATIASTAAIGRFGAASAASTAGVVALTGATRALSAAMAFVGGPVGLLVTAAAALGAYVLSTDDATEATKSFAETSKKLRTELTALSNDELSEKIKKDADAAFEMTAQVKKLQSEINSLKDEYASTGSFKAFNDAENKMKDLAKLRDELAAKGAEIRVSLDVQELRDQEAKVRDALSSISNFIKGDKISVSISDLIDASDDFEIGGLDGIDKIEAQLSKDLKTLKDKYAEIPIFVKTQKEAEFELNKLYNEKIAGLTNDADISKAKAQYDAELAQLRTVYEKRSELIESYKKAESAIIQAAEDEKSEILKAAANEQEQVANELARAALSAQREVADERGKITLDEQAAYAELDKILQKYPELESQVSEARLAIKRQFGQRYADLNDREAAEVKASQDQILDIIDSARRAIASTEDLIVMDKEDSLAKIEELYATGNVTIEQYENAKLAILEEAAAKEAKIQEDRDKKAADAEKARQERQSANNEKFTSFASQFEEEGTPAEQLFQREQEAYAKLQELWMNSNAAYSEYEQARNDIAASFAEQRESMRQQEQEAMLAHVNTIFSSTSSIFDSLASLAKNSEGETSSAYKAMFALSKGFAIAQAGLNFTLALSNALASGPFPANLAAMAQVATTGASLVSSISGAAYSGRQNGGPVSNGNLYKVNENGPEVYSYGNNDYLMGQTGGKVTPISQYVNNNSNGSNVTINNMAPGISVERQQGLSEQDVVLLIRETVPTEINNTNSKTSASLKRSTTSRRRIT